MKEYIQKNEKEKEIFDEFKHKVLKIKITDTPEYDDIIIDNNTKLLLPVGLLVLITNIFWLIRNLLNDNLYQLFSTFTFIMIIISCLASIYIILLSRSHKKLLKNIYRYSILFYHITIIVLTLVLNITRNIRIVDEGSNYGFVGVSLSYMYVFITLFMPLARKRDSFIVIATLLICTIIPALPFVPGNEAYPIISYLIVSMFVIVGYIAFSIINKSLIRTTIKEIKINNELISHAHKDALTYSLNRRALNEYWDYLCNLEEIKSVGVLIFDIDCFKKYNDTYSHKEGDKILQKLCYLITSMIEDEDKYFFRYGGEEFIYIINNPTDEKIIETALKIKNKVWEENFKRNDGCTSDRLTISIGCANMTKEQMIKTDYISEADNQLYLAKNNKKNCVSYKGEIYR